MSAITFPRLANGSRHIFDDSLYIGKDVDVNAAHDRPLQMGRQHQVDSTGTLAQIINRKVGARFRFSGKRFF